ncbi:hypothetical protein ACQY0O_007308 [Thecaphora frezii]
MADNRHVSGGFKAVRRQAPSERVGNHHAPHAPHNLTKRQAKSQTCKNPVVRKEWFSLTEAEKKSFFDAYRKLQMPGNSVFIEGGSVLDDIACVHIALNKKLHFNGGFFPQHTALLRAFYHLMRLAGYTGPEMYIDTLRNPTGRGALDSPLWSPDNFGGDGHGGPIPDGPMKGQRGNVTASSKNLSRVIYWPAYITRNFSGSWLPQPEAPTNGDMFTGFATYDIVDEIFKHCKYEEYRPLMEQLPHGTFHAGMQGNMLFGNSVYEIVFWGLHGFMDKLWRSIQIHCGDTNYEDYGGPAGQVNWKGQGPGANGPSVTLDDTIDFLGLFAPIKVRDVISPTSGINCYTYDTLYVPGQHSDDPATASNQPGGDSSSGNSKLLKLADSTPGNPKLAVSSKKTQDKDGEKKADTSKQQADDDKKKQANDPKKEADDDKKKQANDPKKADAAKKEQGGQSNTKWSDGSDKKHDDGDSSGQAKKQT